MSRVVYRGDAVSFQQEFKDGATVLIPKSANYPSYSIKDPDGTVVQTGAGVLLTNGLYKADWAPALDLEISNEQGNWVIEWFFIDDSDRQYTFSENFELKDDIAEEESSREQKFIALGGKPYVAKVKLLTDPHDITLDLFQLPSETPILSKSKSNLIHRGAGNLHSYEYKVPILEKDKNYMAVWNVTDTQTATPRYVPQVIEAIGINRLALIPQVRMLIDKFQKVAGTTQGYEDSDIIEYLNHGSQWVNSVHPATFWTLNSSSPLYCPPLTHYLIMGAAWYGLTAQHILEGDLSFNFSGLTTTLDMDRTGMLESALGRMHDHVKEELPKAKLKIYRLGVGVGGVGVRVFGRRNTFENFSFKLGQTSGNTINDFMQGVGIFLP